MSPNAPDPSHTPTSPDAGVPTIDASLERRRMQLMGRTLEVLEEYNLRGKRKDALVRHIDTVIRHEYEYFLQILQRGTEESKRVIGQLVGKLKVTRRQLEQALQLLHLALPQVLGE